MPMAHMTWLQLVKEECLKHVQIAHMREHDQQIQHQLCTGRTMART